CARRAGAPRSGLSSGARTRRIRPMKSRSRRPTTTLALLAVLALACRREGPSPPTSANPVANPHALARAPIAYSLGARPSIVLFTLDTTRADHLGCYGFAAARTPHLDALARESERFAAAHTTCPITLPAHSSMLTGLLPFRHGVRD